MKLEINEQLCVGCGLCEENMPTIFMIKNQVAKILPEGLDNVDNAMIDEMIADCPAEAIQKKSE